MPRKFFRLPAAGFWLLAVFSYVEYPLYGGGLYVERGVYRRLRGARASFNVDEHFRLDVVGSTRVPRASRARTGHKKLHTVDRNLGRRNGYTLQTVCRAVESSHGLPTDGIRLVIIRGGRHVPVCVAIRALCGAVV